MTGTALGPPADWIARAGVGELAEDVDQLLKGKYGPLIALLGARSYFELLGKNALVPTQRAICARQCIIIDAALKSRSMRRLERELDQYRKENHG